VRSAPFCMLISLNRCGVWRGQAEAVRPSPTFATNLLCEDGSQAGDGTIMSTAFIYIRPPVVRPLGTAQRGCLCPASTVACKRPAASWLQGLVLAGGPVAEKIDELVMWKIPQIVGAESASFNVSVCLSVYSEPPYKIHLPVSTV
jgi:hypothetical protein